MLCGNYPYDQILRREIFLSLCETSSFINSLLLNNLLELNFFDYILDNFLNFYNFSQKEFLFAVEFLQNLISNVENLDKNIFCLFIEKLYCKDFPEVVSNCLTIGYGNKDERIIEIVSNLEFSVCKLEKCYRKLKEGENDQQQVVSNFSGNFKGDFYLISQ